MNIATIHGGEALNVVPDQVIIAGEVRSLDTKRVIETVEYIRSRFNAATKTAGGGLEFSSSWEFEPYIITSEFPLYQRIFNALDQAGLSPVKAISAGGSDANHLNARGIPAVNIGIGAQNPHANDEFVLLEDLESIARIAWALIAKNRR